VAGTIVGDLRALAKGRACQIRLPDVCLGPNAGTVLAHYRLHTGVGRKPTDTNGAWACHACHDEVDSRTRVIDDRDGVRLDFLDGVMRTLELLAADGYELRRLP
jgi:hypothetical protein